MAVAGYGEVGEEEQVGGYRGWLTQRDPRNELTVVTWEAVLRLPEGRRLVVVAPAGGGWDRDALDRFVRAIVIPRA
jgi:hypothetical protein